MMMSSMMIEKIRREISSQISFFCTQSYRVHRAANVQSLIKLMRSMDLSMMRNV